MTDTSDRSVDPAIIPPDESERMAAVRRYDILDTPPDGAFDRLTALAARLCGTPIAIVSVVDTDRIWFKSHHGLDVDEIDREPGLCASAILRDGPWVVEDARADPRTMANPLVAGEFGLGFYAGVPLRTAEGFQLGTLCVIDQEARPATEREIQDLTDLAAVVMDELELRRSAHRLIALEASQRRDAETLAGILQESLIPAELPTLDHLELAARYLPADRQRVGGDFYDAFASGESSGLIIGDVSGHGPAAAALTGMARHTLRALGRGDWTPAASLTCLNENVRNTRMTGERRFATVAAVRLDQDADRAGGMTASVALAGHPHPLVLRADGRIEEVGTLAPLLGWRAQPAYDDSTFRLDVGDALVLYTDGLLDADDGSERFGDERLHRSLGDLAGSSADDIAARLMGAVAAFASRLRDDVAVLVARIV
jgi:sigma-B regulation protein RsbU (phosphoserine phosphatase)